MDTKTILLAMIVTIFLVGTVSAFEFDNVKTYDVESRTMIIDNTFLKLFGIDEVARVKHLNPQSSYILIQEACDTYDEKGHVGYNCKVGEFEINLSSTSYENVIKEFETYDYNNLDHELNKNYFLRKKVINGSIEIPVYETICNDTIVEVIEGEDIKPVNQTCETIIKSYENRLTYDWVSMNNSLYKGTSVIGVYVDKSKSGERVEYIPTFFGVRMEEWADYSAYTRYEYNYVGQTAMNLEDGSVSYGQTFTIGTVGTNESITFKGMSLMMGQNGKTGTDYWNITEVDGLTPIGSNYDLSHTSFASGDLGALAWYNNTWTGEFTMEAGHTYAVFWGSTGLRFTTGYDGGTNSYAGGVRMTYSQADITSGFSDVSYDMDFVVYGVPAVAPDTNPNVTLIAPANASTISSYTVNFYGDFKDDLQISNSSLFIWNSTGLWNNYNYSESGNETFRNQSITFGVEDNEEIYYWNYLVYDNVSQSAWGSANLTFNLTVISTNVELSNEQQVPVDNYLSNNPSVTFGGTQTVVYGNHTNATLNVWNSSNYLYYSDVNTTLQDLNGTIALNWTSTFPHDIYNWTLMSCARNETASLCVTTNNYTFSIDTKPPTLDISEPSSNITTFVLPILVDFNATATDTNLDDCWYITSDNATATQFVCNTNVTINFTTNGEKDIYYYANDSLNNVANTNTSFLINYIIPNMSYETPIAEGTPQEINFILKADMMDTLTAIIEYQGVNYSTTEAQLNSTLGNFTAAVSAPSVNGSEVIQMRTFYTLDGDTYVTEYFNQTVFALEIILAGETCTNPVRHFDLANEQNLTSLIMDTVDYNIVYGPVYNTSLKRLYGSVTNATTFEICLNESTSFYYVDSAELQYSTNSYADRRFYLYQDSLLQNGTLINTTLYSLLDSEDTVYDFEFIDTDLSPYEGKYGSLLRWYPSLDEYKVVGMTQTDENGKAVVHVETEDVDYRVGLYHQNGSLIKLFEPVRFVCSTGICDYTLRVDAGQLDLVSYLNVEHSLTYDNAGTFTFTYNDPSELSSNITLRVTREGGTQSLFLCGDSSTAQTGVLTCNVSAYSGTFKAVAYREASPATPIAQKLSSGNSLTVFAGSTGLFITMILWLAILLTGFSSASFSPLIALILGIAALIPALILGSINLTIFTGIIVLGVIVMHFVRRAK